MHYQGVVNAHTSRSLIARAILWRCFDFVYKKEWSHPTPSLKRMLLMTLSAPK